MPSPAIPDLAGLRQTWQQEGWLHLPRFWQEAEVEAVEREVDRLWAERPGAVTVDDVDLRHRCRMSRLPPAHRAHRIKLNDLYLRPGASRALLLEPRLVEIVAALLGDPPVLCNSLNLEKGSGQDYHVDALYMTPLSPSRLVACWIALEDVRPGAGPLRLYPRSHLIPPFTFSDGSRHAVEAEMPQWATFMQRELEARGLEPESVHARAGDLVLWHADLLHGAEPIAAEAPTRKSLVGHYFTHADCRRRGYRLARAGQAFWMKRRSQPTGTWSRLLGALERRVQRARALVR